ncbi:energy-coupling factor transport system ATP-binding protein [Tumebacillus sp. BK434]|uniref:ATP-binding cassette domain-containing protein n=1 Tax=Tumebacillus sp. BK434 TaxID=2512169 RepID=UPI00104C9145|nr:ATP-binding cassette domain-containing protein [Tumebacillus sp. BK434]TCP55595.1 energy-coupling factor transport system ATP-binding protein [Tumebacillus sp. BK434]
MKKKLTLSGVSVAFAAPDGVHTVLTEIDLTIAQGEWVALIGQNGSGKSTLAKVLCGLCPVSKGLAEQEELQVQMVFQNPEAQIVGETVYEDVCFGMENCAVPPDEMPERALAALEKVGLAPLIEQAVTTLSGGQKQLLGIAGCLAVEADVIVFDECTAMLDPASREMVLRVAQELQRQGKTLIWITQWMEELACADRVVALSGGRVAYDGTARAFFYDGVCAALGFVPPYAVQVAEQLQAKGVVLAGQPLTPQELSAAVGARCQ